MHGDEEDSDTSTSCHTKKMSLQTKLIGEYSGGLLLLSSFPPSLPPSLLSSLSPFLQVFPDFLFFLPS